MGEKAKMRVVFDANVFISFFLTRGSTIVSIFSAWEESFFEVFACEEILDEIRLALRYPKFNDNFTDADFIALELLFERVKLISPKRKVRVAADSKDNIYLAAAFECRADFLVTGDKKHLLPLGKFHQTKIISPKEFALEIVTS